MPLDTTRYETLERILDAALAAVEHHGIRKTTMDDIARRAGVGRATVYDYFVNKTAILSAVVNRELVRLFQHLEEILDEHASLADRVAATFTASYPYLRNHRLLQRLLATEPEALQPFLQGDAPALQIGYAWTAEQLRLARGKDAERSPRDRELAELLCRLNHSLIMSPRTELGLDTAAGLDAFARRWLVPLIEAGLASTAR